MASKQEKGTLSKKEFLELTGFSVDDYKNLRRRYGFKWLIPSARIGKVKGVRFSIEQLRMALKYLKLIKDLKEMRGQVEIKDLRKYEE